MIQEIIALSIVFFAAGYTLYSVVKNLTVKKSSHCGGCEGCSFKELPKFKSVKAGQMSNF